MLVRIGDLKPGELFEIPGALNSKSKSLCLKLRAQKVLNLDTMTLWREVDQNETVHVLNKKLKVE
jgi:hypothetical protein